MAAGAIGELTSDAECPPESVELLGQILQRPGGARRGLAPARPDSPGPSARHLGPQEELLAEAVCGSDWPEGVSTTVTVCCTLPLSV